MTHWAIPLKPGLFFSWRLNCLLKIALQCADWPRIRTTIFLLQSYYRHSLDLGISTCWGLGVIEKWLKVIFWTVQRIYCVLFSQFLNVHLEHFDIGCLNFITLGIYDYNKGLTFMLVQEHQHLVSFLIFSLLLKKQAWIECLFTHGLLSPFSGGQVGGTYD